MCCVEGGVWVGGSKNSLISIITIVSDSVASPRGEGGTSESSSGGNHLTFAYHKKG